MSIDPKYLLTLSPEELYLTRLRAFCEICLRLSVAYKKGHFTRVADTLLKLEKEIRKLAKPGDSPGCVPPL